MNAPLQARFRQQAERSVPFDLKGVLQRAPADIQPVLDKVGSQANAIAWEAGWIAKVTPMTRLPFRFLLLHPEPNAATSASYTVWGAQSFRLLGGMLVLLTLVLINATWIYRSRKRMECASRQLGQAFSALASLDL